MLPGGHYVALAGAEVCITLGFFFSVGLFLFSAGLPARFWAFQS